MGGGERTGGKKGAIRSLGDIGVRKVNKILVGIPTNKARTKGQLALCPSNTLSANATMHNPMSEAVLPLLIG